MEKMTIEERFEASWNLLYLRLFKGLDMLVEQQQWWPAAVLCAIAIDIFADTLTDDADADARKYTEFLRDDDALREYGVFADRFYGSLRCGLVHRMIPKDTRLRHDPRTNELVPPEGPVALADGCDPPRLKGDHLVIDVPHLVKAVHKSFDDFRRAPHGPRKSRFIERMNQVIYDETPDGLVPRP